MTDPAADSIRCLGVLAWRYRDVAALVAADLGLSPRETVQTTIGGDGPQRLINETAQAIADGELDVALIGGGEAVATLIASQRAGTAPQWRAQAPEIRSRRIIVPKNAAIVSALTGWLQWRR